MYFQDYAFVKFRLLIPQGTRTIKLFKETGNTTSKIPMSEELVMWIAALIKFVTKKLESENWKGFPQLYLLGCRGE